MKIKLSKIFKMEFEGRDPKIIAFVEAYLDLNNFDVLSRKDITIVVDTEIIVSELADMASKWNVHIVPETFLSLQASYIYLENFVLFDNTKVICILLDDLEDLVFKNEEDDLGDFAPYYRFETQFWRPLTIYLDDGFYKISNIDLKYVNPKYIAYTCVNATIFK